MSFVSPASGQWATSNLSRFAVGGNNAGGSIKTIAITVSQRSVKSVSFLHSVSRGHYLRGAAHAWRRAKLNVNRCDHPRSEQAKNGSPRTGSKGEAIRADPGIRRNVKGVE